MSVTPMVMRRLLKELAELQTNPPEGIRVVTNENNMLDVTGVIEGPEGTPYAGGYFRVKFRFTEEFPAAPPKCWFATKIFHPNVGPAGEICVNTLKKDWKSEYGVGHILVTVKCLLIYPNPESALDEEAGRLLLENYDDYCSRAKLMTSVHATPRVRPAEFDNSASVSASSSTPKTTFTSPSSGKSLPSSNSASSTASSKTDENGPAKGSEKERLTSPAPLGVADSNVAAAVTSADSTAAGTKAVKRSATGGLTGAEKRKKALKRL